MRRRGGVLLLQQRGDDGRRSRIFGRPDAPQRSYQCSAWWPPFLRSPPSACRREAAAIANQVLQGVLSQIAAGEDVADLCDFGDALIAQLCGQVHKTKKLEKGIAFPTCVSVNECVGHFSPLKSESRVLADGDVVKV